MDVTCGIFWKRQESCEKVGNKHYLTNNGVSTSPFLWLSAKNRKMIRQDLIFLPHANTINNTHSYKHTLTTTTSKDLQYHMHTNWTKCRQSFNHITVNIRDNEGLIFVFERYTVDVIRAHCYIYLPMCWVVKARLDIFVNLFESSPIIDHHCPLEIFEGLFNTLFFL